MVDAKIYSIIQSLEVFEVLDQIDVEYRKPYLRLEKLSMCHEVKLLLHFHKIYTSYDYKISGGSPPNMVMCEAWAATSTAQPSCPSTSHTGLVLAVLLVPQLPRAGSAAPTSPARLRVRTPNSRSLWRDSTRVTHPPR